jgi:transcriptional regulator with XRE-family HTH domain
MGQKDAATKIPRANIIGPQIRRLRCARGWSQAKLAVHLQLNGLNVGREFIAQIENQTHCIKDKHIPYFATALDVKVANLFLGFDNFD